MIREIRVKTRGELDIVDITDLLEDFISKSGIEEGILHVFLRSTTSALFINEHESGLLDDLRDLLQKLVPKEGGYRHNMAWGEENGHSHLRSILLGTSLRIPFREGRLLLGTWQRAHLIELDVRPRERSIILAICPTSWTGGE